MIHFVQAVRMFLPGLGPPCGALVLCVGLALAAGCSQQPGAYPLAGAQGDFVKGREAYEQGHMLTAIELLESFERNHPGSQFIDDGLYYLGKAHQGNNEQLLGRQAFRRVVEDFPRSPYAEDARFEIARCWFLSVRGPQLDAEPAEEALRSFRVYLRRYPEGRHVEEAREAEQAVLAVLAEKDFLNGRTYMRLGRSGAARRYFEKSLEIWAESPHSAQALDGIARSYERGGDWARAGDVYQRLGAHLADHPERFKDGESLARRASEKLSELPPDGG